MNEQEIYLYGGAMGGGKTLHNYHLRFPLKLYLTFNVNCKRVIVMLPSACDMKSVVQFVANAYHVPIRLVKYDKGVWEHTGNYDLAYNP